MPKSTKPEDTNPVNKVPPLAVFKNEDDNTFAGNCACGYATINWPTEEIAQDRIKEHGMEHAVGQIMSPVSEFRDKHGLVTNGDYAVFPEANVIAFDPEKEGN